MLRRVPTGSAWRDPVTWLFAALSLGAYFVISLYRLLTLTPSAVDLGTFTEFERQVAHFHAPITDLVAPGMNIEGDHFQVAIGVIAPFFRLFPSRRRCCSSRRCAPPCRSSRWSRPRPR